MMGLVFKSFLIVILILLIFVLIGLTFNTDKIFYTFELENEYETKVSIIEQQNTSDIFLGITTDNLEFGVMPRESVSKRFLNLTNNDDTDYKIILISKGNITPFVNFEKNDFILHKDETVKITVFLNSSPVVNLGNYTGEIYVISKRPRFLFLNNFMEGVK